MTQLTKNLFAYIISRKYKYLMGHGRWKPIPVDTPPP